MKNIEWSLQIGLQCDYCDFKDDTLDVSQESVGMKCPKCGENLLTQEDFDMGEKFRKSLDIVNSMSEEDIINLTKSLGISFDEGFGKDFQIEATVKIHNGINLEILGENLKNKEIFKEANDRAREFFKNIKELPI